MPLILVWRFTDSEYGFRSRYLKPNSAMLTGSPIEKPLEWATMPYGSRGNVQLTYGKIGGHIGRTDTA